MTRIEPALIVDATGSMTEQAAPHGSTTKAQLATDISRIVVEQLFSRDSQAADERGTRKGGVLTRIYHDGIEVELGDLTPDNFASMWNFKWRGGTYIMPALSAALNDFQEEFSEALAGSDDTVKPILGLLIINDGELSDQTESERFFRSVGGQVYTSIVVLGYGPDHDAAVRSWRAIAAVNPHVKVTEANASTDAVALASDLLSMFN